MSYHQRRAAPRSANARKKRGTRKSKHTVVRRRKSTAKKPPQAGFSPFFGPMPGAPV